MKKSKIVSAILAAAMVGNVMLPFTASAEGTALTKTSQSHKFTLGSTELGGTGVENGGKNWIKIVQNSNDMRLFDNVSQGIDVAALQVTFDITEWSGKEFGVTWGGNIDFIGDESTTWCGTSAFENISNYTIDANGRYTVTCDLAELAESKGKEGIAYLQTCEMVITGVEEGDPTMIDIKSAAIYEPGEIVPEDSYSAEIPEDKDEEEAVKPGTDTENTNTLSRDVVIDGNNANTAENMLYRGQGMISANNSSRLLIDYKNENPEAYWEIMNYIFGEDGLAMSHLKVEMGSDINSSSGTEPAVMRSEDEEADVTRGAAYQLAADAKTINPDITLDMLWWSEPKWVSSADDVYAARYKWYKETLDAAYETYGLKFDYVGAVQNERSADHDWIKYLASHLDSETDCPYDYSEIKIVAGDEVCTWNIAKAMMKDEELRDAIDVIGSHYTSWSSSDAKTLAEEYGKELWFSEASPSMSYSKGTYKYDGKNSGLADIHGTLDIANRIITMYPGGLMTLYEYQPAVAAYYDGVTYCHKQLIKAREPWSGAYELDSGFYMGLHFSQFIKTGWAFIDDACYADGKAGGDGHAVVNATYSYITATDTATDDYSTVITNTTDKEITYNISVKNLDKASSTVYVWETRGPESDQYNENYFKKIAELTPQESNGSYIYSVTLKPYSMVTFSTLEVEEKEYTQRDSAVLALPYDDDYEYEDYGEDYLSSRGAMPRYTTDEGGAFEVCNIDDNNVVMQKITSENKANEWGWTPDPMTNFGDDRWFNYSVSADILLEATDNPNANYAGLGLRYRLAGNGASGYWAKLSENGKLSLMRNGSAVANTEIENFNSAEWNNIKVEAVENVIKVYFNNEEVIEYTCENEALLGAGRAAYYSSYNNNCFDNFKAEEIKDSSSVVAVYDETDDILTYDGSWNFTTTGSWKNFNRSSTKGSEGASVSFSFEGMGFALFGESAADSVLEIKLDGEIIDDSFTTVKSGQREISVYAYGLDNTQHEVEIKIVSGTLGIDGLEIVTDKQPEVEAGMKAEMEVTEPETNEKDFSEGQTAENQTPAVEAPETSEKNNPVTAIVISAIAVVIAAASGIMIYKKRKS